MTTQTGTMVASEMPLTQTFFSPRFGMVADRFGVRWMVIVVPPDGAHGAAQK